MKKITSILLFSSITTIAFTQPCKLVKPGMSKQDVIRLVGKPTEIDTVISPNGIDSGLVIYTVWQYGDVMNYGHQRVEFEGDIVLKEVIADGKKFDELMLAYRRGEIPDSEIDEKIRRLNLDACQ